MCYKLSYKPQPNQFSTNQDKSSVSLPEDTYVAARSCRMSSNLRSTDVLIFINPKHLTSYYIAYVIMEGWCFQKHSPGYTLYHPGTSKHMSFWALVTCLFVTLTKSDLVQTASAVAVCLVYLFVIQHFVVKSTLLPSGWQKLNGGNKLNTFRRFALM